tara:strand:+ start:8796 stop:12878 length:4083 start_codon:yes stop_codon:yes gene_type:complete
MPPRITQNDKREQTGRIPDQLKQVQRETSTVAKNVKQLSQSKQGQVQFSANDKSAFNTDPSIATALVGALRPAAKAVEAGVEVRDRIDKEKFEDVVLFAQNTNANGVLGYEQKLKLISDAYDNFKPMSKKYQIAAHTQKTKVMQQLNGIQDKLLFSNWATQTTQKSMLYPVNPEDGSMSREEFLNTASEDLRNDQPRFMAQSMVWQNEQQVQLYKKQFNMLNSFASLQAKVILNSKNPDFFSSAGNENQFKAELETALENNGHDPRDVLGNPAIMEGINNQYAVYKTTGNTVAAKRGAETNLVSSVVNAQTNNQGQPHLFGNGIYPSTISKLIIEQGLANASDPRSFISRIYSEFSNISKLQEKPSTEVVETLGAFPIINYTDLNTQELVRKVREDPSYLDDMFKDKEKYRAIEKALSDTEMLMKQEFRTQLGARGVGEFLNRPSPEDFSTPPVTETNKVEDILTVINTDKGSPDDRVRQTDYVVSQAMYYAVALGSQQDFMQYDQERRGVGVPLFNKKYEYQANKFTKRMEAADFRSQNPTEKNTQARKSILEELDKNNLLRSIDDVDKKTRFFSTALNELSNGITIGGVGDQTGSFMLNGVIIAAGESGAYGNPQEFIESQEGYLKLNLEEMFMNMSGIDEFTAEKIKFILDDHEDNSFGAAMALEQLGNDMKTNPNPDVINSFVKFKTVYRNFVEDYAKRVQFATKGLIVTTDNSFKLGSDPSTMIPFLSGSVASSQAFDSRSGSNISTVSAKASDVLAKQIFNVSSQMKKDMVGEDFNVEEYRKNSAQMFTAITQLYGTDMRSPVLSGLRSSLVEFTAAYLGIPENITSAISDPDTEASRNIILRDFLLNNGRSLTALNESQRRAVSSVTEGFQSFFVDANNQNAPLSFLPDFNNILRTSDVQANQGQTLDSPDVLANNAFNLDIDPTSFQPNDSGVSLVSTEVQAGFANDVSQSIVQGVLNDREIRFAFLENGKLHTSLLTSVRNAAGMTGGLNDSTKTAGSSTDLVLDELDRADKRLVISIVKAEGKGNPNVNAMVGASLKATGADADTLAAMGGYAFHTEVIQGTLDDKNRIQFVPFDLPKQEEFKSNFATEASRDISIVQKNTNLSRVSVPAQSLQKVLWNFDQLFTVTNKYGVLDIDNQRNTTITMNGKENLFRKPLRGSTPEPYLDIVKILATPAGPYQLLAGRTFKDGAGKSYTESGMSLFGLNQVAVLYQATKAIVEEKGVEAGLTYLKEIHDRYQRTDNTGEQTSIYAYVNNEGEFLYMGEEKGQPVFVGGERLDGREIIQKETQEFIDNILLTTERTDIKTGQFDRSNPRFRIFQTHDEQEQIRIEQAQREANRMSNRGASWLFHN